MKKHFIFLLFNSVFVFSQYSTYQLSRADDKKAGLGNCTACNSVCESRVKVKDEKPNIASCDFGSKTLFKVYEEEFDGSKEELLNNWGFNYGYTGDDDYDSNHNGHIWMGTSENALANNVTIGNGEINLILKKEHITQGEAQSGYFQDYELTGAALSSKFSTTYGKVIAEVKFPNNNLLWPAVWKLQKLQEIDIFEAWDDNIAGSNCEKFHQFRMHIHNKYNTTDCVRGRKFPLNNDYYDSYHKYQCDFTDFRVDFLLDDNLVGYANKYYQGLYAPPPACTKGTESGIPNKSFGCNGLMIENDCNTWFNPPPKPSWVPSWVPWPTKYCLFWNYVDKDEAYPKPTIPMDFRISIAIRDVNDTKVWSSTYNKWMTKCEIDPSDCDEQEQLVVNNWNTFDEDDKKVSIRKVEIWELIDCNNDYNICSIMDFLNFTNGGSFLGGRSISLSNIQSSCNFININPVNNDYKEYPLHLLAIEEIAIKGGNVSFEEGTFLRAEIIECNTEGFTQRSGRSELNNFSDEEIAELEKEYYLNLMKNNPTLVDSLVSEYNLWREKEIALNKAQNEGIVSQTDNNSILVFPNPTSDILNIDMVEEDFNDILYLELTNGLGQTIRFERTKQLNLENYASGLYQLKFIFSHGYIVVKSINKQ